MLFADVFAKDRFVDAGFIDRVQPLDEIASNLSREESDEEGRPVPEDGVVIEIAGALPK